MLCNNQGYKHALYSEGLYEICSKLTSSIFMIHLHFAFSVDFCGCQSRQLIGSCQPYEPSYWSETLKKMASSTASWYSRCEEKD